MYAACSRRQTNPNSYENSLKHKNTLCSESRLTATYDHGAFIWVVLRAHVQTHFPYETLFFVNQNFLIYFPRYTREFGRSSALTALSLSNGALTTSTTCGSTRVRGHMCVRSAASPSRTPAACVDTVKCTRDCGLISAPSALSLSPRHQTSNRSVDPDFRSCV